MVLPVFLIAAGINYYASCTQARIFNSKNNTHYTCIDFMFAGNQINSQTQTINLKTN
jgi:hypothetical protein